MKSCARVLARGFDFLLAIELVLFAIASLSLIKAVKLEGKPWRASKWISVHDVLSAGVLMPLATFLCAFDLPLLGFGVVFALTVLFWALWVDALLFTAFTIELGPGGVGDVVLSSLIRELAKLTYVRTFLRAHALFLFLPLITLVAHAKLVFALPAWVSVLLLGYFIAAFRWPSRTATDRQPAMTRSPCMIVDFVRARRLRGHAEPRAEHRLLLEAGPSVPQPSDHFGRLRGRDIVLITMESVAQPHLGEGKAHAPFLERLANAHVSSANHFVLSPTTNNAHLAWYFSAYLDSGQDVYANEWSRKSDPLRSVALTTLGGPARLAAGGYTTVYLSASRAKHYGLETILSRAGFQNVLDGFGDDHALLGEGLHALQGLTKPLFLHIHLANTHVPYAVVDRARFGKRDARNDYARYLDSIEESDFIISELAAALPRDALLVVTSDHGQSFGDLGYYSHGSAVLATQINVPFIVAHPELDQAKVAFSSHFDVLPTLCDLVGIESTEPSWGSSIFCKDRPSELFVWAGHPSRTTTSNFGLIAPEQKIMLDLVADQCLAMRWDDNEARELTGVDRTYYANLFARLLRKHHLS